MERSGPATVGFDDLVDLGHDADGVVQGDDDLLVVGDVLIGEGAALPILEPFVTDLVASPTWKSQTSSGTRCSRALVLTALSQTVFSDQPTRSINFDMPWNPMRLVQRHGRIDRIGSPHKRVFLRTIFPTDRLDHF